MKFSGHESCTYKQIKKMSKDEYLKYIEARICKLIVEKCLKGEYGFGLLFEPKCDEDVKGIFPKFTEKGIEMEIKDKIVEYHSTHCKDGIVYTISGEPEDISEHYIDVSWKLDKFYS